MTHQAASIEPGRLRGCESGSFHWSSSNRWSRRVAAGAGVDRVGGVGEKLGMEVLPLTGGYRDVTGVLADEAHPDAVGRVHVADLAVER